MVRLIEADRLAAFPYEPTSGTEDAINEWIEEIFSTEEIIDHKEDLEKLCWKVINGFIGVIETEPTVDAVEVVHGEWNICEDDYNDLVYHTCSNCGAEYTTDYGVDLTWKFCPNCGAKMDGGRQDEM